MDTKKLEDFLQEKIFPDVERGRLGDKPHTLLVAKYLKEIVKSLANEKLDLDVLLIAGYAHDWGYTDMFKGGESLRLATIGAQKDSHMLAGLQKLQKLLKDDFFNFLTEARKERAAHLVSVHDKLENLKEIDELVLMEADSLGGMDIDVMGVFQYKESEERFMKKSKTLRFSKSISDYGKAEYERLYKKRIKYFQKEMTKK